MGLIGWYKLDGNANDSAGDNDGTPTGVVWTDGILNDCGTFDSDSAYVDFTQIEFVNGQNHSCSVWIKWTEGASRNTIPFGLRTGYDRSIYVYPGSFMYRSPTSTYNIASWDGTVFNGEWNHLAWTVKDGTVSVYVNGTFQGSSSIADTLMVYSCIGKGYAGAGYSWGGLIDDYRIYDHVLSLKEIKELTRGKAGHWKLNNPDSFNDESGFSNDATNSGTVFSSESKILDGSHSFSTVSTYINLPNDLSYRGKVSAFAWFKSNGSPGGGYHIIMGGQELEISIPSSTGELRTGVYTTSRYVSNHGSGLLDGNWHHIGFTFDGTTKTSFIDGVSVGTQAVSGALTNVFSNRRLGIYGNSSTYWTNGLINDVRVYATALSANEVEEIYKQRGSIDNSGNLVVPELVETSHKPLLMDYTVWEDGQTGGVTGFGAYSSYNRRILANDPWSKETVVWEAYSVDASSAGGGIYATAQSVDNTKMYRMSWWEKRVSNSTATYARYYAGLNGYGSVDGVLRRDTGVNDTNPYFYNTSNIPTSTQLPEGEWVLVVGHVWPAGSGTGSNHSDSGRYTLNEKLGNISRDYVWRDETTTARSRTLMVYQPNAAGVVHYTVYPRLDVVDGTEPSIAELLAGFDSNSIDYVRGKGGTKYIAFDVNSKLTYTGDISEVGPSLGLIGWWPLNGDTDDISGEENTTTNNGATVVPGLNQLAYNFNGTSNYIDLGYGNALNPSTSPHSFSLWVKPAATGTAIICMSSGQTGGVDNRFYIGIATGGNWDMGIQTTAWGSGSVAATTNWTHITVVMDGTTATLYVNKTISRTISYTSYSFNRDIYLANHDSNYWFNGLIQDVRIYDRALSEEEVKTLYEITGGSDTTKMKKTSKELFVKGQFTED